VYAFVTLVLPVALTFALMEASPRRATPGKRRLGFVVVDRTGHRLNRVRSVARSVVKFAPWQMAHTAVFQFLAGNTAAGYVRLSIVAQVLVLSSIVTMALDPQHRPFHDLVAGTRVVRHIGNSLATPPALDSGQRVHQFHPEAPATPITTRREALWGAIYPLRSPITLQ
jgi:uncharacterized RDD family membrane protein YckC